MTLLEPENAIPQLRSGELDLAITFHTTQGPEPDEGLAHQHLIDDPMYLVLPTSHRLATRRTIRLADLSGEAWIGGPADCECNRLIYRACAIAGYDPRIAFETDDYQAVQGFVAAGVGVSLIAELGLRSIRDDIVVRDLGRETPIRSIHATTLAEGYRSPASQAMLGILADVAAGYEMRRPRLSLVG
jgi:DNA-binding transcriptional LysR family regulator